MELFKNKNLVLKITIALIVVILFNFSAPTFSYAAASETIGGILLTPVVDLLIAIGDSAISVLQEVLFGIDNSLIKVSSAGSGVLKKVFIVGGTLIGVGLAIASLFVPGGPLALIGGALASGGTITAGMVISGAAASILPTIIGAAAGNYVGHKISEAVLPKTFYLPIYIISPEEIFKGQIGILDVNFFSPNEYSTTTTEVDEEYTQSSVAATLQSTISSWYNTLRNFSLVILMVILLYVGIRILTSSVAQERAKYKEKLFNWLVAICLLFFMHYIMSFATTIVQAITRGINSVNKPIIISLPDLGKLNYELEVVGQNEDGELEKGKVSAKDFFDDAGLIVSEEDNTYKWPTNLMGMVRLEMQMDADRPEDNQLLRQLGYAILFLFFVFYTIAFLIIYIKRVIMIAFLTMIAPLVAMTYPLDKMNDGNAQAFNMWLKEYVFNLLIQPLHLILYTMLVGSAMDFAETNIVYAIVAMAFIFHAEKILRKFFGFEKAGTLDTNGSTIGGMLAMAGINQIKKLGSIGRKGKQNNNSNSGNGEKNKIRTADKGMSSRERLNQLQEQNPNRLHHENPNINRQQEYNGEESPQQRMLDAYDENYGTSEWDPQYRDAMARDAYQPISPNYSAQEYADVLRNVGYDNDEIEDIIRNDPRYAVDKEQNLQLPLSMQQEQRDQQAAIDLRQRFRDNIPDQDMLDNNLDNDISGKDWTEDDNRGVFEWLGDKASRKYNNSDLKDKVDDFKQNSTPARLVNKVGQGVRHLKEKGEEKVKQVPKPIRNSLRGATTVVTEAGKTVIPGAAKLYIKGVAAATTGIVGAVGGATTGDLMNATKYGAAGIAAGGAVATAAPEIVRNTNDYVSSATEHAISEYTKSAKGEDAEKKRQEALEELKEISDKAKQKEYMEKLKISRQEIKKVMKERQEYRKSGVTDDRIIMKAMDAKGFGDGRANNERVLLAQFADKVGNDNKKIKDLETRLKERGLNDTSIKKYIDGIRDINQVE